MAWLALVSIAPDFDFIGVWFFGVPEESLWGHRGFTHSLAVSGLPAAIVTALWIRRRGAPAFRAALVAFLAGITHPLLDLFTIGSVGVPLWWPISAENWRVTGFLPSVITAADFLTPYGVVVLIKETIWFLPIFLYALWPRKKEAADRSQPPLSSGSSRA